MTPAYSGEFTVRVRGYKETARALQRVNRGTRRAMMAGLIDAAKPVSDEANRLLDRYQGVGTIIPRSTSRGVVIRQSKRKVTGLRGDFGSLQMKRGLLPAAYEGQDVFKDRVEDALGVLFKLEGF